MHASHGVFAIESTMDHAQKQVFFEGAAPVFWFSLNMSPLATGQMPSVSGQLSIGGQLPSVGGQVPSVHGQPNEGSLGDSFGMGVAVQG